MSKPLAQPVAAGQRFPELRRWPRYPVSMRAEAIVLPAGGCISGGVSILSRGGCYFRTVDTQAAGNVLRLRIESRGQTFETWARVVHAVSGDGMGMAFFDTHESHVAILTHWLAGLSSQTPVQSV